MLQLHVTDDRGAVTTYELTEFPVVVGRSAHAGLCLSAPGVFEEHARIDLVPAESGPGERVIIESLGSALVSINGAVLPRKQLAVGDEVSLGAARVLVSLSPARQRRLSLHEASLWSVLVLVVLIESLIIHLAR